MCYVDQTLEEEICTALGLCIEISVLITNSQLHSKIDHKVITINYNYLNIDYIKCKGVQSFVMT